MATFVIFRGLIELLRICQYADLFFFIFYVEAIFYNSSLGHPGSRTQSLFTILSPYSIKQTRKLQNNDH